jgi:hypothetical protein
MEEELVVRPAWSDPTSALVAATLAGLAAVGADLVVGGGPTHTLTLGLAAIAIGALRLHPQGRSSGAADVATVALLSQPLLHAATAVIPVFAVGVGPASVAHRLTETPIGVAQLVIAAVVIVSMTSAEPLLRLYFRRRTVAASSNAPASSWDIALPPEPALHLGRRLRGSGQRLGLRAPPVQPAAA